MLKMLHSKLTMDKLIYRIDGYTGKTITLDGVVVEVEEL